MNELAEPMETIRGFRCELADHRIRSMWPIRGDAGDPLGLVCGSQSKLSTRNEQNVDQKDSFKRSRANAQAHWPIVKGV